MSLHDYGAPGDMPDLQGLRAKQRTWNALRRAGVGNMHDLMLCTRQQILRLPEAGGSTWADIERMQTEAAVLAPRAVESAERVRVTAALADLALMVAALERIAQPVRMLKDLPAGTRSDVLAMELSRRQLIAEAALKAARVLAPGV